VTDATLHESLRRNVRDLCARFPDAYWRDLETRREYPEEFVATLTGAGYLASLIPEQYGGAGLGISEAALILEEINRSGANGAACHAQMYIMGTLLRHGSEAQKQKYLPAIARGDLRLQAFGVTEPDSGVDTSRIRTKAEKTDGGYLINGLVDRNTAAALSGPEAIVAVPYQYGWRGIDTNSVHMIFINPKNCI